MPHTPPLIIIADHDKVYLELMLELLTEEGYQVVIADGGAQTYELIRQKQPDMAILDLPIRHPDSVLTTITMLRMDPTLKKMPILICSVTTELIRDNSEHLQHMGCQILAKPFYLDALLEGIRTSLSSQVADETAI